MIHLFSEKSFNANSRISSKAKQMHLNIKFNYERRYVSSQRRDKAQAQQDRRILNEIIS